MSEQETTTEIESSEVESAEQVETTEPKAYTPPATQEAFNRVIEERLVRERKKYADYDELKANQAEFETWKESQLTEQEKAIKAAREEGEASATSMFQERIVKTEIRSLASQAGFSDPEDAVALFGGDTPVKDGEPDADAITARLGEIAAAKPYLLKDTKPAKPAGKPKLPATERRETTEDGGKGRAAAAMRQLGKQRIR